MPKTTRYRRCRRVTKRRVGATLFLAHPDHGRLYRLNPTVAALWNLLVRPTTITEAVGVFRSAFPDESAKQIRESVLVMFTDLFDEGLIEGAV